MSAVLTALIFLLIGVLIGAIPLCILLFLAWQFFEWIKREFAKMTPINEQEEKSSEKERFKRFIKEG